MDSPKISILVPVYNVERYLQECIRSILSQDFRDFELILVDDGSTDNSSKIVDDAAKSDERVRVIHKTNGGLLSARKAAVAQARGEYYVFWDSDDLVPTNALSLLYHAICSNGGYDLVKGTGKRLLDNGELIDLESYTIGEIHSSHEYLVKQYKGEISPYIWNGIYKASLFDNEIYDIAIDHRISIGEDYVVNVLLGKKIQRALVIDEVVYYYRYNQSSMMNTVVVSLDYHKRLDLVFERMKMYEDEDLGNMRKSKYIGCVLSCCFKPELSFPYEDYKKVRALIDQNGRVVLNNQFINPKFSAFVTNTILFYLYSRCYCFLFKHVKLNGKTRSVIY